MTSPDVLFSFDPACPWTWMTSRWLVEVADRRSLSIGWRPLSLAVLNGDAIPEQYRAGAQASFRALRLVQALQGDDAAIGRLYAELGERFHRQGMAPDLQLVREAAEAAGVDPAALDDDSFDDAIAEATTSAVTAAGGDVGSPVISWPDGGAIHGPIVSPPPTGDDALALWDVICAARAVPGFFELKRGRSGARPQIT